MIIGEQLLGYPNINYWSLRHCNPPHHQNLWNHSAILAGYWRVTHGCVKTHSSNSVSQLGSIMLSVKNGGVYCHWLCHHDTGMHLSSVLFQPVPVLSIGVYSLGFFPQGWVDTNIATPASVLKKNTYPTWYFYTNYSKNLPNLVSSTRWSTCSHSQKKHINPFSLWVWPATKSSEAMAQQLSCFIWSILGPFWLRWTARNNVQMYVYHISMLLGMK